MTFSVKVSAVSPSVGIRTGTVTFSDQAGMLGTETLNGNGVATFGAGPLAAGNYTITASYAGDGNFNVSNDTTSLTPLVEHVNKVPTSTSNVTSSSGTSVHGQVVTLSVSVGTASPSTGPPVGTVTFSDQNGTLGTGSVANGAATFSTQALSTSIHTITASYGGNPEFAGSNDSASSTRLVQTVNKAGTSTTGVTSSVHPSVFGQTVTFSATFSAVSPGTGIPTGTVTFSDQNGTLGTGSLNANGRATFSTSNLSAVNHAISASYAGDPNFMGDISASLIQNVNKAGIAVSVVSSPAPSVFGQAVILTATVGAVAPGAGNPSGSVTFKEGTVVLGSGTLQLSAGIERATFSTKALTVGSQTITAAYAGDANFLAATGNDSALPQRVNPDATTTAVKSSLNPSVFGQPVTFTALVHASSPGSGVPAGTVTFKEGTSVLGSGTLNGGQATFSTATLVPAAHTIVAVFGGSASFKSSTSAVFSQQVNKAGTATALSSGPSPSVKGQSVILTATVKANSPGSGTPSGSVTFKDGTTVLGSGILQLIGGKDQATFSTKALAVGSHTLSATYNLSTDFLGSSASATQMVSKDGTATAVKSSLNPALVNQTVTFTATVSALAPGSGTPTGTVTFKDSTTVLGTATLTSAGLATFSTAKLTVATHSITATYGGDGNFTSSLSPIVAEVIKKAGSSTPPAASSPKPSVVIFAGAVPATAAVTGVPGAIDRITLKSPNTGVPSTLGPARVDRFFAELSAVKPKPRLQQDDWLAGAFGP